MNTSITDPTQIDHPDMVKRLAKDGLHILQEMTPHKAHLWHMATGISGESGELLDAVKKHVAYNISLLTRYKDGQTLRENLIEELGDLEFYMEGVRQAIGVSREETLMANKRKLFTRYASFNFTNEAAQKRADKESTN